MILSSDGVWRQGRRLKRCGREDDRIKIDCNKLAVSVHYRAQGLNQLSHCGEFFLTQLRVGVPAHEVTNLGVRHRGYADSYGIFRYINPAESEQDCYLTVLPSLCSYDELFLIIDLLADQHPIAESVPQILNGRTKLVCGANAGDYSARARTMIQSFGL